MHAFRNILLAITRSHTTEMAFQQVVQLVKDNRATLHVALFDNTLDVMHKLQFLPIEKQLEAKLIKQLEETLSSIKKRAWEKGITAITHIIPGRPRETIVKLVNELHCDLVIKLADPSGVFARNQLAGNDLALIRKCPVPILMIADRDPSPTPSGSIMVAIDTGKSDAMTTSLNTRLLQYGLYLSAQEQTKLHCVTVWDLPVEKQALRLLSDDELYELQETVRKRCRHKIQSLLAQCNIDEKKDNVRTHLLKGQPSHEIQRLTNELEIGLLVMGTIGQHSKSMTIGSTAENILNGVYCSILAVKPDSFDKESTSF